jgi:hypothetical protein
MVTGQLIFPAESKFLLENQRFQSARIRFQEYCHFAGNKAAPAGTLQRLVIPGTRA